jgi:hypothetical protein
LYVIHEAVGSPEILREVLKAKPGTIPEGKAKIKWLREFAKYVAKTTKPFQRKTLGKALG